MNFIGVITIYGDIIQSGATKIVNNNNNQGGQNQSQATRNASAKTPFAATVTNVAHADKVISLLNKLMKDKRKPKDVMMPIRAAMDAGAIRRPTWEEFCYEFGLEYVKQKSSFSIYTNPDNNPYDGANYDALKEQFRQCLGE